MKHSHKKSFDWYSMHQRYSIRKYHFGAASVLLGTALVLGAAANAQTVQAEEQNPEVTNIISVDKVEEATKPVEVSTPKKETTYAAPTVAHPVETTSAKTEEATKLAEASTPKKETTYTAPTVAHPVETTPVKTEAATKPAEKVEEAKDKSANICSNTLDTI